MKSVLTTVNVSLSLPPDFQESCRITGIQPEQTIQSFVDNVSIYSYLRFPAEDKKSFASTVFKTYVNKQDIKPIENPQKRERGLYFVALIMKLINGEYSEKDKVQMARLMVRNWYDELLKINKV